VNTFDYLNYCNSITNPETETHVPSSKIPEKKV
jgi:hypothetical protein